jgi:hypothetical protein
MRLADVAISIPKTDQRALMQGSRAHLGLDPDNFERRSLLPWARRFAKPSLG